MKMKMVFVLLCVCNLLFSGNTVKAQTRNSFKLQVKYFDRPLLIWDSGEQAESYVIWKVNPFTGVETKQMMTTHATQYVVPCEDFSAYMVVAIFRDGSVRQSNAVGIQTSKCLKAPRVQIIKSITGFMISWDSVVIAEQYVVLARDPYTRKQLDQQVVFNKTHALMKFSCNQVVEIAVLSVWEGSSSTPVWQKVRSRYGCE